MIMANLTNINKAIEDISLKADQRFQTAEQRFTDASERDKRITNEYALMPHDRGTRLEANKDKKNARRSLGKLAATAAAISVAITGVSKLSNTPTGNPTEPGFELPQPKSDSNRFQQSPPQERILPPSEDDEIPA